MVATEPTAASEPGEKGAQTREAILATAIARFGRDGFRATSVTDITRDAKVSGTLAEGWTVEVMDEAGKDCEVYKTRRSQTLSLSTGEFAIVKDFEEDIGGRDLSVDYRYDGNGWFQIWADDHILLAQSSFAQQIDTVPIPVNARKIKIIIGDEDQKRPYSDQKIVELLKKTGIDIARRTVAKYREQMGILSSSKRKQLF